MTVIGLHKSAMCLIEAKIFVKSIDSRIAAAIQLEIVIAF